MQLSALGGQMRAPKIYQVTGDETRAACWARKQKAVTSSAGIHRHQWLRTRFEHWDAQFGRPSAVFWGFTCCNCISPARPGRSFKRATPTKCKHSRPMVERRHVEKLVLCLTPSIHAGTYAAVVAFPTGFCKALPSQSTLHRSQGYTARRFCPALPCPHFARPRPSTTWADRAAGRLSTDLSADARSAELGLS